MNTFEFEFHVREKSRYKMDLDYCVIALNEEAGEVAGWYKKYILRGNPTGMLTKEDLKGELGDCLYYITALAQTQGWTLEEIMDFNKVKLDDRVAKDMKQVV